MNTYDEWEQDQNISPLSPEASYAEDAWNAALQEVISIMDAAYKTEDTSVGLYVMMCDEIIGLMTK